jgi:hypothetical protein
MTLGVTLHARPPESMLGSPQIIFPCHEGIFLVVQFPLSYKELLLQLSDHYRHGYRIQERSPAGGDIHPRSVRWRLAVIMAGAPAIRMFTTIFSTSHHGQRGQDEYSRSAVREGDFYPILLKIKRARSMVRHLASCTIEETGSGILEPTTGITRGVLGTSTHSQSKPRNGPLTANGDQACTSTMSIQLTW